MKDRYLIFILSSILCVYAFAQSPSPVTTSIPPSPASIVLPATAAAPSVSPTAAPQWAQDLLSAAANLPIIGPLVSNAMIYAGIASSILTAIVLFLLTVTSAISGVGSFAGLTSLTSAVQAFQSGPIMYWLKFFSMFNAQKPATANLGDAAVKKVA